MWLDAVSNDWGRNLPASVLGQCLVVVINQPGIRAKDYIFKYRTEANRVKDIRLLFGGKTNGFGITLLCIRVCMLARAFSTTYSSFNVENATVAPTVFIIPNQRAFWVGRQGRLPRSGQAKEDRHITILAFIGR